MDYGKGRVTGLQHYSSDKVGQLMDTSYGKAFTTQVSSVIDTADKYVNYYLPDGVPQQKVNHLGSNFFNIINFIS